MQKFNKGRGRKSAPKEEDGSSLQANNSAGIPRRFDRNRNRMMNHLVQQSPDRGVSTLRHALKAATLEDEPPKSEKKPIRFRNARTSRDTRDQRSGPQSTSVSTTNVPIYDGLCTGMHAVCNSNSHNLDFSSFQILVREMHNIMVAVEPTFCRSLPFCVLQHYCCEILNAVLIERVKSQNVEGRFRNDQDPFDVIHAANLWIPTPFVEYLNGIGSALTVTGEKVFVNLPTLGTPRTRMQVGQTPIPSGTLGAISAVSHNNYECYVSPYVTGRLIERTIHCFGNINDIGPWTPLPAQLIPANSVTTVNLLGYEEPEIVRGETVNQLRRFLPFRNDDTMAGRLSHSDVLMNYVSSILRERSSKFKMTEGLKIESSTNPAIFIVQAVEAEASPILPLSSMHGQLECFTTSGPLANNMCSYFAYKRRRTEAAPGYCLVAVNGDPLEGWNATINNNLTMAGQFGPTYGEDLPLLREVRFTEAALTGSRNATIRIWLEKNFNKRT